MKKKISRITRKTPKPIDGILLDWAANDLVDWDSLIKKYDGPCAVHLGDGCHPAIMLVASAAGELLPVCYEGLSPAQQRQVDKRFDDQRDELIAAKEAKKAR